MIVRLAQAWLKTKYGDFLELLYYDGQKETIALVKGNVQGGEAVLCRLHSACIAANYFNSIECDCREQMAMSQSLIEQAGSGVIIWLDQEGKGNGHLALLASRPLKAQGVQQAEAYEQAGYQADARNYRVAAEILRDLGVYSVVLLTGNTNKTDDLKRVGINIAGTRPILL